MISELAELARIAVADAVKAESLDLVSLVNLVADAGEPEEPFAREFRSKLLDLLDDVAWIPLKDGDRGERPMNVFGARSGLIRRIGSTFPSTYIRQQTGLGLPDNGLKDAALELVTARPSNAPGLWKTIEMLCLPGKNSPWDDSSADSGFRSLIDLFEALDVEDRNAAQKLLKDLRRDPRSRLIPAVGGESGLAFLPIPDPSEGVPGRRSRLVMARVRSSEGPPVVPPDDLDVAFLPDGLLSSEAELDRAKPLGVRPFTVDNVLDRLSGIEDAPRGGEDTLVRFLWQLLAREGVSGFSMRRSVERASIFDPSEWFWCRPGRGREDETAQSRQRRERYLAAVPLPCRDGGRRQAGQIAFGADWAAWLEESAAGHPTAATQDRISAYRAMEQISPGPEALLAPPETVLSLLAEDVFPEEPGEEPDERQRDAQRHAFLLRLGVWEVPPIEAYESQDPRNRSPWMGPIADKQRQMVGQDGWQFGLSGWTGTQHHHVYLAEDYWFLWPLEEMAQRNVPALVTSLRLGAKFYGERSNALVFCPGCSDGGGSHRAWRHSTSADGYPSSLAIQLRSDRWVPCTRDGEPLEAPSTPRSAWWHPKPPSGAGLLQSPWRLVPLCSPAEGMNEDLRRLVGINTLGDAQADVTEALLVELREQFEHGRLPIDPFTSGSARQAFVGLHRLAYERLSELSSGQSQAAAVLDRIGVLCELGEGLVYRHPGEARHDDGRFTAYVRHFAGSIPFVVLPRDRGPIASGLDIKRFQLKLTRRGEDEGRDVTDDIRSLHGDRIAELLSIMVHHSLGTQTLDAASDEFERRARRIRNLRIKQMDGLVVDAVAEDSKVRVTLGEGARQDLFLENPTSDSPVLFHDLSGDGWQDRLRRKIAPYLAMALENQAYAHTFALFLQAESDAEREEFLLELGISTDEVDAIKTRIGVVSEEERQRHARWFRSILDSLGAESLELDPEDLVSGLVGAGLPARVAHRLVELGGGEAVRRETGEDSALQLLAEAGLDLKGLHSKLLEAKDPGLDIRVARNAFSRWKDTNGRRLSAVFATKLPPDEAKERVRSLRPPEPNFSIEPALPDLLSPVVVELRDAGLHADANSLAHEPEAELVRLGAFESIEELDANVSWLFDEEEQRRFLSGRAAQWRREIQLLAVLAATGPADTPTTIRAKNDEVMADLPRNPSSPPELRDAVKQLFANHQELAWKIEARLVETLNADAPDRKQLLERARQDGVDVDRLEYVKRVLEDPGREHARKLKERSRQLADKGVRPVPPPGFEKITPPTPLAPKPGPKKIKAIKVGESHDRRKRELGDEGERWALAAVVGALMDLDDEAREAAIGEIVALLEERFEGAPVAKALGHATRGLDDEELIEELSGLLHISQYSDEFGFDLVGWLPLSAGGKSQAVYLEVKSGGGEGFHLSRGQWSFAEKLHSEGAGDRYTVLVVRREKSGGVPAAMHLLSDPVALVEAGDLRREADGYQIAYRASDTESG